MKAYGMKVEIEEDCVRSDKELICKCNIQETLENWLPLVDVEEEIHYRNLEIKSKSLVNS